MKHTVMTLLLKVYLPLYRIISQKPPLAMKQKILLFSLLFYSICFRSYATHMAGADLTYQSLGGGQYLVTYTFYRDCNGIPAQTSLPLDVFSTSCGLTINATLLPVPGTGQLISFI